MFHDAQYERGVAGLRLRHVGVGWRAARQSLMACNDIDPEITRYRNFGLEDVLMICQKVFYRFYLQCLVRRLVLHGSRQGATRLLAS
jgi:hypothetical protein